MAEKNYFTISEVSGRTKLPEYTIRYWETKFRLLRPLRLVSGHRRYTARDIETLGEIKDLVFVKGYSLDGARKALSTKKRAPQEKKKPVFSSISADARILEEVKKEIKDLLKELQD